MTKHIRRSLSSEEIKCLDFLKDAGKAIASRDYAKHIDKSASAASTVLLGLVNKQLVEYFDMIDESGFNRRYYCLVGLAPQEMEQPTIQAEVEHIVPSVNLELRTKLLRDPYDEKTYGERIRLYAESYLELINDHETVDWPTVVWGSRKMESEKTRLKDRQNYQHDVGGMVSTWFPAWEHIQAMPFDNPTGRFRSDEEIEQTNKTGIL